MYVDFVFYFFPFFLNVWYDEENKMMNEQSLGYFS